MTRLPCFTWLRWLSSASYGRWVCNITSIPYGLDSVSVIVDEFHGTRHHDLRTLLHQRFQVRWIETHERSPDPGGGIGVFQAIGKSARPTPDRDMHDSSPITSNGKKCEPFPIRCDIRVPVPNRFYAAQVELAN